MTQILVIGAGVIGLQTANTLLDAGFRVTILAQHWPGDEDIAYTSPWAGAIWRTHASPDKDPRQCEWNVKSYRAWMDAVERGDGAEMGIQRVPITIYSNTHNLTTASPSLWYAPHVQSFNLTPLPTQPNPASTPPHPQTSISFASLALNPSTYLTYLLTRARSLGATTTYATLPTDYGFNHALTTALSHLASKSTPHAQNQVEEAGKEGAQHTQPDPIIINCTGLASSSLVPDPALHPIRGQTLLARLHPAPAAPIILLHDASPVTYVVPRVGTDLYLLGGTNERGNWSGEPSETVTKDILARCGDLLRRGGGLDGQEVWIEVVKVQVGLRPGREGGVRVEREDVRLEKGVHGGEGRVVSVVHAYGHAGAGFQGAVGCAEEVLELVRGCVGEGIAT